MAFGFTTSPLDKQFYHRFKALKKRYELETDREMLECLIWFAVEKGARDDGGLTMKEVVDLYKSTAPSDTNLPEV